MAAFAQGQKVRVLAGPLRGYVGEVADVFLASPQREFAIGEDPAAANVVLYQVECAESSSRASKAGLVFEAWLEPAS